jgi:hypothetical protein
MPCMALALTCLCRCLPGKPHSLLYHLDILQVRTLQVRDGGAYTSATLLQSSLGDTLNCRQLMQETLIMHMI